MKEDQLFHLAILEDPETGYKYDGLVIKESAD